MSPRKSYELLVIGAGPAGMAAAISARQNGVREILVVDREDSPGGILNQCIHTGFGLHKFGEELTGPEYSERYVDMLAEHRIEVLANSCVIDIVPGGRDKKVVILSDEEGLLEISCKALVLAMGCRERNRGNIAIPGTRPAGIMTAGFAQKMINIYGYMPGKEIVILGSGDIGLIMARRLSLEGARVKAVIEIQSHPGGLNRNIVQCLDDFNIPLLLSHTVTEIRGLSRIRSVKVAPVVNGFTPCREKEFTIRCDTLLLSIGLIPENELSLRAGIVLDDVTRGPVVDSCLMTSVDGIFACGNVLQVHDIVDWVSEEAEYCGKCVARHIAGEVPRGRGIPVRAGKMLSYALPSSVVPGQGATFTMRCATPLENVRLCLKTDSGRIYSRKLRKIFPSIMQRVRIEKVPEDAGYVEAFLESNE